MGIPNGTNEGVGRGASYALELPLEGSVVGFAGGNKEETRLGHTLSNTDGNVEGMWVLGSNVGLGDSIKVGFAKICRELTLTLSFFHGKL